MFFKPINRFLFLGACLMVFLGGAGRSLAGDQAVLTVQNSLDEEILSIRTKFATPRGVPIYLHSTVMLPPGQTRRISVAGASGPERVWVELATRSFDYSNLGGLGPDGDMRVEVTYDGGRPGLRRDGFAARGMEWDHLTDGNRPYAVDRDHLTDASTWNEAKKLVLEAVEEWRDGMEEDEPEDEPAELEEFLYEEDAGWGKVMCFPVEWMDWYGVARVEAPEPDDPGAAIHVSLGFRLPGDSGELAEMLKSLLDDLRVDGFRPSLFGMRVQGGGRGVEIDFLHGDGDRHDDQDAMQGRLFAAYANGTLADARAVWVQEDSFDAIREGGEAPVSRGVALYFNRGSFVAAFMPDDRLTAAYLE